MRLRGRDGRESRSADRGPRSDEAGFALVLVTMSLVALLGAVALAVDLGMLYTSRTESQRVADLAALAGAGVLVHQPTNEQAARQTAIDFAGRNEVRNAAAVVEPGDVEVLLDEEKVRVRVFNTAARGNAIGTFFARIMGIQSVDVSTVAAAQVYPATSANCLLPVALPDRWANEGGPGYDPDEGDVYIPYPEPGYTSYTADDIGTLVVLKPSQGGSSGGGGGNGGGNQGDNGGAANDPGAFEPGWWYLWIPDGPGASKVKDYITGCPDPSVTHSVGDWVTDKNGNMQSVVKEFEKVIDDPAYADQHYDAGCKCVLDGQGNLVTGGLRYRAVPVFDPNTYTKQGSGSNFQIASFAGVFIEGTTEGPQGQKHVLARFMGYTGLEVFDGTPAASGGGPLLRIVRLVE